MSSAFTKDHIKLVFGLGNPGAHYAHTYHNAGVLFVGHLRHTRDTTPRAGCGRKAFEAHTLSPEGLMVAKSAGYMNESGAAVSETLRALHVPPAFLLLAHDETDLPLGTYRISFGGGAAGHKGVQSVIDALRTQEFWRLRIGVRDPIAHAGDKAGDFVLTAITRPHAERLEQVFREAERLLF